MEGLRVKFDGSLMNLPIFLLHGGRKYIY